MNFGIRPKADFSPDYSESRGSSGTMDCPYTYMHDLAAGRYRLPWEEGVRVTDGTGCGIAAPIRMYGGATVPKTAE